MKKLIMSILGLTLMLVLTGCNLGIKVPKEYPEDAVFEAAENPDYIENDELSRIFLYYRDYEDSTFELDESCKDYFKIEAQKNLSDKTSQVKISPIKETEKISLIIYEIHKEDNVPKAVNVYKYEVINKYNSDNQLVIYFESDIKEITPSEKSE